jgi:hypothetical protein
MEFRKPTIQELFPHAIQQDLAAKQSVQYVNNIFEGIAQQNIERDLPPELVIEQSTIPLIFDSKPKHFYVSTYLKNHWRMITFSIIIGGIIIYAYQVSIEKKRQKKFVSKVQ